MPTDLEQQLPLFAEALDREAPAISIEEILGRAAVALDADHLEQPAAEQVARFTLLPWGDSTLDTHENGEHGNSIELATAAGEPHARRRVALRVALAAAAALVLVVALAAIVRMGDDSHPVDVPPSTVRTVPPSTVAPPSTAPPTTVAEPPASGGMWPQSTVEEVHAAQQRADAGDPEYAWQVGNEAQLSQDDAYAHVDELELVDRFLREVLGWDAYMFNGWEGGEDADGWVGGAWTDQRYLRCAPGRTNPLYPPGPDSEQPGESCAPTVDDLHYESVRLDLAQLDRQGRDGVWVVKRWELTAPFAQADAAFEEAEGTRHLEEFLAARVAGTGAEGYVQLYPDVEVPLLYSSTSGTPYARYEIERVDGPFWPTGRMTFAVRLFADDDATVVEQWVTWDRGVSGGLWLDANTTTENGQPVPVPYISPDGEVSLAAPGPWSMYWPCCDAPDVWFGMLASWGGGPYWDTEPYWESGKSIGLVDPVAYDSWCAAKGGSPLLTAPAAADAIAQQLVADPNLETTAPVAARVGGLDAVSIDVALAPGGKVCQVGITDISRWVHELNAQPGLRLRLYLVDLPEGMSVDTMAITVVAPEASFDAFVQETASIIESIAFHPQSA